MECWLYTRLYLGLIGAFQAIHSAPSDTQLAVCTRSARFSVFHRPFRPTVAIDEFSLSPKHQHDHRLTASLDTSPRDDKVHRVLACSETSARHPLGPLHGSIEGEASFGPANFLHTNAHAALVECHNFRCTAQLAIDGCRNQCPRHCTSVSKLSRVLATYRVVSPSPRRRPRHTCHTKRCSTS